jgi:hypothetical protein
MKLTKLVLYFPDFSTILYEFSKFQQSPKHYLRIHFYHSPLEIKVSLRISPWFADFPSERTGALQSGPWGRGRRRSGEIPAMRRRSPAGKGEGVI